MHQLTAQSLHTSFPTSPTHRLTARGIGEPPDAQKPAPVSQQIWLQQELRRLQASGLPARITQAAREIHERMTQATRNGECIGTYAVRTIENKLRAWNVYP